MPAEKVTKSENRRSNKPLMEKRRRARINQSLSELKNLILDAIKKDSSRNSKLEKADILEMAVKHLQNLQKQQQTNVPSATESNQGNKYRAGFNECATEVSRFLDKMEGLDASVRGRLISHLFNCLNEICTSAPESNDKITTTSPSSNDDSKPETESDVTAVTSGKPSKEEQRPRSPGLSSGMICTNRQSPSSVQPIQVHIPTSSIPLTLVPQIQVSSNATDSPDSPEKRTPTTTTTIVHGLQLIPTRLSNGEIAFVLDNQSVRTSDALMSLSPSLTLATSASAPRSSRVSSTVPSPEGSSPTHYMDTCASGQQIRPMVTASHSKASNHLSLRVNDNPNGHSKSSFAHPPNLNCPLVIKEEDVWRPW